MVDQNPFGFFWGNGKDSWVIIGGKEPHFMSGITCQAWS